MTKATEAAEKAVEIFDLASLDTTKGSDEGARIELVHPVTRDGLGMYFTVLGKHSTVFREMVRERVNKRVRQEAAAQRKGKPVLQTAEEFEANAVELLVACTLKWETETKIKTSEGEVTEIKDLWVFKGEELTFNYANATRIYTNLVWVREQVDEAIADLENFIKA